MHLQAYKERMYASGGGIRTALLQSEKEEEGNV